jgi:hypothetical protein
MEAMTIGLWACLAGAALAADPVGWRTDATGRYPDAKPVLEWSTTKHVLWKMKTPSWSNATPVLAGEYLFITAEPTTLVCVRATDGEILWQKTNTYADLLGPEGWAAEQENLAKAKQLRGQIGKLRREERKVRRAMRKKPKDAALKKKLGDLRKQAAELGKELAKVDTYLRPSTHKTNGYASCTPVVDGRRVYVLFGTGVAACYDLDGTRRWITLVEKPTAGWGHSSSPVLAGDTLVAMVRSLIGLDKTTGKVLWQTPAKSAWGSPVVTRVGNVDVVVTPNGDVVRARDGEALARKLSRLTYCAPIVHDGVAYFIEHGGRAVKLSPAPDAGVKTEPLWTTKPKKDRYYASPVLHEGLLYAINQKTHFSVIDAKDGKVVHEKRLNFGKKGQAYQSVVLAGDHLFLSREDGTTAVLSPGREPKVVAENPFETFRGSIVCDGDRFYIRGVKHLYCIGKQ